MLYLNHALSINFICYGNLLIIGVWCKTVSFYEISIYSLVETLIDKVQWKELDISNAFSEKGEK